MAKKRKLLVILGSGGHTTQILKLVDSLGSQHRYDYLVNKQDRLSETKIKFPGKIFRITLTRNYKQTTIMTFIKLVKGIIESVFILLRSKPETVISAGPGITVPMFIAAKFFHIRTIFLESWSRVERKSNSGKICYKLSDIFFVQWPSMLKQYPRAIFAGRLG